MTLTTDIMIGTITSIFKCAISVQVAQNILSIVFIMF
jgi:hypothetical protein